MDEKLKEKFSDDRPIVCIQGLGFVGSAMAVAVSAARSDNGKIRYNVIGVDMPNESGREKTRSLNNGVFPFENSDKKIDSALKNAFINKNLWAVTDESYYKYADVIIVDINLDVQYSCDGEPYLDLTSFEKAMHTVGRYMKSDTLLLVETTVPPGTCEKVVKPIILEEFANRGIESMPIIAHSYERVMPGENYLDSIINYWRVYSGIDEKSADICQKFLESVIQIEKYPLTRLERPAASEIAKVLENSYRAVTIAFMEEWGRFAESINVNLFKVIEAIRMRPTHSNMRQPGFGVGGYCLTKDPYFAGLASKELYHMDGMEFPFSTQAVHINNEMPLVSLNKIEELLGGINGKRILVLGISYRQDVGDTRYSPSEIFVKEAIRRGAVLEYQDPLVTKWNEMDTAVRNDIPSFEDFDVVLFAVQHKQYDKLSFCDMELSRNVLIFDANCVLSDEQIKEINNNPKMNFYSIGRGLGK